MFLAGDSAHTMPPAGGLGLNCGIQDAHDLSVALADVMERGDVGSEADEAQLDQYFAQRHAAVDGVLRYV